MGSRVSLVRLWLEEDTSAIFRPDQASDTYYPGQFVVTLKHWGSCYTAHDGGFVKTAVYKNRLML